MFKSVLASCVICLFLGSFAIQAQDVFVLPGINSNGTNVQVFAPGPLNNIKGFSAGAGAFLVLAKPDGSEFYALASTGGSSTITTITSVTNPLPKTIATFSSAATAGAISEDGKRIALAAGLLHIFDTSRDAEIGNGVSLGQAVNVFDVVASLDGKTFYALGYNPLGGSILAAVDVSASSPTVSLTLPIAGPTEGVALGPNGLIYVTAPNLVLEINPATLQPTATGKISVRGQLGKMAFTPDGNYALAVNQFPNTGSQLLLISLPGHSIYTLGSQQNQAPLAGLVILNSTNFLAYDTNGSLFKITLSSSGTPSIAVFNDIMNSSGVTGLALSSEVPGGGRTFPQYLFAVIGGILYREDLPTSVVTSWSQQVTAGALSYAGPATSGTLPNTLIQYGNNQTVAPSGVSLPLVLRVLDNSGNPISGSTVTFTTNNASAVVSPASAVTGTDGFAVTYVTVPSSSNGPIIVTATAGNASAAYTLTVGTASGGGGSAASISILAGQGQLVYGVVNTGTGGFGSPFIIQVNDANGVPSPNVPVTFAVTQGPGSLPVGISGVPCTSTPNCVVLTTDSNGQVSEPFLSSGLNSGVNSAQTTITVSATGAATQTLYVTTLPPGASATAQLAAPAQGAVLSGQAGSVLKGAVQVVVVANTGGLGLPNVSVRLTVPGGASQNPNLAGASCNDPTGAGVLTDTSGSATCDVLLNGHPGTANLVAEVGYQLNTANFMVNITAGPPGQVNIVQGNNQTGSPGQALKQALLVQVTDSFGNALPSVPVTWSVLTPGAVTLSNLSTATDTSGNASALATLGSIAGNAQVKVTAGTASATFTLTVNIPAAGISKVSGDAQTTIIGTAFQNPLVVSVVDANGKPVSGAPITFQVTGSATLSTASTTTDVNGQASTKVTAGGTAGNIIVTASTASLSTQFHLTAFPPGPTNVTFVNAASFQAGAGVAPGEIVIISGNGLATGVQGLVTAYNIIGQPQPSLAGITVMFNGVTAPIYYVLTATGQLDQVAVQVPFETQPGTASVVISSAGGGSGTFSVQVQQYAPGVFQTTVAGQQIAVVVRSDGSYVSPSNPAHPGEVIQVFVTGLGQLTPATATGSTGAPGQVVAGSVVVGVNNGGVPLISATYAQGMVGVYVLTLQIPADTQTGPAQPLGVVAFDAAGNTYFAQGTVIPIM